MDHQIRHSFIDTVADQLIGLTPPNSSNFDPLTLVPITVCVPSHKFAHNLSQVLIQRSQPQSVIMPKIFSLLDIPRDCKREASWIEFLFIVRGILREPKYNKLNLSQDYEKLYIFYNFINQLVLNATDLNKEIVDVPLNCMTVWEMYGAVIFEFIQEIHHRMSEKNIILKAQNIIDAWQHWALYWKKNDSPIFLVNCFDSNGGSYKALDNTLGDLSTLRHVTILNPDTVHATLSEICHSIHAPRDMIECQTMDHESSTVAWLVREHLEYSDVDIAIVTQDAELQRAIQGKLLRWDISVDSSHNQAWQGTQIGEWVCAAGKFIFNDFDCFMAVLKHPLSLIKLSQQDKNRLALDITHHWHEYLNTTQQPFELSKLYYNLPQDMANSLKTLLAPMIESCQSWSDLRQANHAGFSLWATEHLHLLKRVTNSALFSWDHDQLRLWQQTLNRFEALSKITHVHEKLTYDAYINVLKGLFADIQLTASITAAQVRFVDLVDSITLKDDRVICCGLNENLFPSSTLASYGLPLRWLEPMLNKRDGDNYQAFTYLFNRRDVILTRSVTRFGQTQLPSQWWQEVDIYLMQQGKKSTDLQHKFQSLVAVIGPTEPVPKTKPLEWLIPPDFKITTLTIRDIDHLMHHPYGFFMKHFLKIKATNNEARAHPTENYGLLMHKLLADSTSADDFAMRAQNLMADPKMSLAWCISIDKIMAWINTSPPLAWSSHHNVEKNFPLTAQYKGLTLNAQIDQAVFDDRRVKLVDFKTGSIPAQKDIESGHSVQFPILSYCANQMTLNLDNLTYLDLKNLKAVSYPPSLLNEAWPTIGAALDQYQDDNYTLNNGRRWSNNDILERRQEQDAG